MQRKFLYLFFFFFTLHQSIVVAQQKQDSPIAKSSIDTAQQNAIKKDTVIKKKFNPRTATIRSLIIPGWGQAYNKKYWKIPIVYGALGTTTAIFFYNLKYYKKLRKAVILLSDTIPGNNNQVDPALVGISVDQLRTGRNEFRQNIDYSVLFFLLFWGLNVVDATVDAHLKGFDVSPSVSMKIKAGLDNYTSRPSLSLVFFLNDNHKHFSLPLP